MDTVREICQYIGSVIKDKPLCIETGCAYVCAPGNEVHTTTNNILEYVADPRKGQLFSIDLDQGHIDFARKFTESVSVNEACKVFVHGDSVLELSRLSNEWLTRRRVDLICLDSKEFDEDHMVNEYNAIKPVLASDAHFVLVDDIYNPNSVKYKKMVPILKDMGYDWLEVPTPTGMFFAAKGYKLP